MAGVEEGICLVSDEEEGLVEDGGSGEEGEDMQAPMLGEG